jgi:hypothetical protein
MPYFFFRWLKLLKIIISEYAIAQEYCGWCGGKDENRNEESLPDLSNVGYWMRGVVIPEIPVRPSELSFDASNEIKPNGSIGGHS